MEKLFENHFPSLVKLHDAALPVAPSGKLNVAAMKETVSDLIRMQ